MRGALAVGFVVVPMKNEEEKRGREGGRGRERRERGEWRGVEAMRDR